MGPRCEETRALAPELALGVADGEERGRALEHLAGCAECRAEVERLSNVADELMLLAPRREAPPGFESRVLARVLPSPEPRRKRLRVVLAPVAAALAAAAITLAVVSDDLRDASHYRDTLREANGVEFKAYALRTQGGTRAGTVFSYEGSSSWLYIGVDPTHGAGLKGAELVTDDGAQLPLGWFHLDRWGGSGGGIPVDPRAVSVLRLQPAAGGQPLVARFGE
jgi:Putative zinc-finger